MWVQNPGPFGRVYSVITPRPWLLVGTPKLYWEQSGQLVSPNRQKHCHRRPTQYHINFQGGGWSWIRSCHTTFPWEGVPMACLQLNWLADDKVPPDFQWVNLSVPSSIAYVLNTIYIHWIRILSKISCFYWLLGFSTSSGNISHCHREGIFKVYLFCPLKILS